MSVVYISGPITGKPDLNTTAFMMAETALKSKGFVVLNPRRTPLGLDYGAYMDIALAQVRAADIIHMLPGWSESNGAIVEYHYANSLGKQIQGADA